MPEEQVAQRAQRDKEEGKSAATQAGEFVREEMHHVREGKHGAQSPQQTIAIGLSKARRAGIDLPPAKKGRTSATQAIRDSGKGKSRGRKTSPRRSHATSNALKRKGRSAASRQNLSRHARSVARARGGPSRRQSARKAARTRARRSRGTR